MKGASGIVLMIGLCSCVIPEDENVSSTSQSLSTFSSFLLSMGPVGYWRLGEPQGASTMVDSSPTGMHGIYHVVSLGQQGAVNADNDTSMFVDGIAGAQNHASYSEVPDHKALSLTRAWDSFNRLNPLSWGSAPDGQAWAIQVSNGNYYSTDGDNAIVNPGGAAGSFQQGLPTTLLGGDMQVAATWNTRASGGPLQPVSLVAQYVDNSNFLRAELVENSNHKLDLKIIRVAGGMTTTLGTTSNIGTYTAGDWWYVRFQFDGTVYRAKAWKKGTVQPIDTDPSTPSTWNCTQCVNGTGPSASVGGVGLRTANSQSSVRPIVRFDAFWTQTLGMTIHLFVKILDTQSQDVINLFGKGDRSDDATGNREYTMRYHNSTNGDRNDKHFKTYVTHWQGGLGAGQDVKVCPTCPMHVGTWHELVFELDSGDALDTQAGPTLYVDGQLQGAPTVGGWYNGSSCCSDAFGGAFPDVPGVPGTCGTSTNNQCTAKNDPACTETCTTQADCINGGTCMSGLCRNKQITCWNVYPLSGDAPMRVGSRDASVDGWFTGWFDEIAIFSRKLNASEVSDLFHQKL